MRVGRRVTIASLTGWAATWLLLAALSGCSRDRNGLQLTAPFDDQAEIGTITAVWRNTGEERAFAGAMRLKEPEVRFQYRVNVDNRLKDGLFVRIGELRLVDTDGLELAKADDTVECRLAAGAMDTVLAGELWVSARAAGRVAGFDVARFGVPLSERGRAMYREWRLQGRPRDTAEVDAEIARYAAARGCSER